MILIAAVLGSVLPATGLAVPVLDWATKVAIALLFYLYGARLSTHEAIAGLKHWRLHAVILSFTYVVFPLIGVALGVLSGRVLTPALYAGLLFMCLVPSTVQSSIAFTSIARGNVAGAIVSASASNLLGVFITPLLVLLLMSTSGEAAISASSVLDITLQLLVPFMVGQLTRRWVADFVTRNKAWLKYVDQGVIVLVVYAAFSAGRREHMWTQVGLSDIAVVTLVCLALLALMLWLTWRVAGRLHFNRADRIAIQFCGTKKSLATGVPMASVIFVGQPIGLIVLPLMIFHQAQLLACTVLSARYARQADAQPPAEQA